MTEQTETIKLIKCANPRCGAQFKPSRVGTINEKKYCSGTCQTRRTSFLRYQRLKDDEEYRAKRKVIMRNWYSNNRTHQNKNVMKNYQNHKTRWRLRSYNRKYRKEILPLFEGKCSCGATENLIIKNLDYEKRPRRIPKANWNIEMKKHVLVVCKDCVRKNHMLKR